MKVAKKVALIGASGFIGSRLLAELSDEVAAFAQASGRTVSLIAESDLNDPLMITPTGAGGRGMTCQWNDDIHHALHTYATGETFAYYGDFAQPGALEKVFTHAFAHDGNYSTFRGSNWGSPVPVGTDGHAFVACTEDHDQEHGGHDHFADQRGEQGIAAG